ncbi:Hypothetical predicted protein [Lecanosticta acicola]|uniref:PH domain-containing protein n=1 Tax=Lecanosticta acicola TaxID=111012 RepID=A0AAI8YZ73_9PEZI|nr:Hypothetical predicted protein [Lecanosticta acicola]
MADSTGAPFPSRYRSQRHKNPSVDEPWGYESPASPPHGNDGVARSKSRYRHKQVVSAESPTDNARPHSQQQQAAIPSRYHSKHRQSPLTTMYTEQVVQTPVQHRCTSSSTRRHRQNDTPPAPPGAYDRRNFEADRANSSTYSNGLERSRTRGGSSGPKGNDVPPPLPPPPEPVPPPSGDLFPPMTPVNQPKRPDGPPQSGKIRATKSMSELPVHDSHGNAGCFGGLFRRRRDELTPVPHDQVPTTRPKTGGDAPTAIKMGGGGAVPGTDAPVSAINAGDRRVLVECGKSKALFPVTPTTTPVDLIKNAATCMSERIDVKSALLFEYFGTVGVQRPLRRYEHIRDIINSWDNDRQNTLILLDPGTGTVESELTMAGVPQVQPEEKTWYLSHSQKVGSWSKRWVTLRSSGQLVSQKDLVSSKEATNICHLSDFDIYMPTPDKLRKKIRAPKKFCYAIKSQQKTSLFESTHNFVHFFSVGDKATADEFHDSIQAWRSWYLVNVMGEGKRDKPKPTAGEAQGRRSMSNDHSRSHHLQESVGSHYQLGSFKPLVDMDQYEHRPGSSTSEEGWPGSKDFVKSSNQFDVNVSPERRTSSAKRQHPPLSLSSRAQLAEDEPLANLNRSNSTNKRRSSTDQQRFLQATEFSDTGLLGRDYSQRRKEYDQKEAQRQEAFTSGPNLLNGGMHVRDDGDGSGDGLKRNPSTRRHVNSNGGIMRSSSTRGHSQGASGDLERSGSRRQKPKPLVDLTPQFKEPPQHANKGKGYRPDNMGQGGLISSATSPEDPLGLPSNTIFRNAGGQYSGQGNPGLVDLSPQYREPVHQARKGRGYQVDNPAAGGGLVGSATSPDDPLGLPQQTVFRSMKAMPENRNRRPDTAPERPVNRQKSTRQQSPKEAFTGEGLLAQQQRQGWGGENKGRGVIDGSHAGGRPLVDLSQDSRFVKGSLLNQVERAEGGPIPAPIIDREKRIEREEKHGEGH